MKKSKKAEAKALFEELVDVTECIGEFNKSLSDEDRKKYGLTVMMAVTSGDTSALPDDKQGVVVHMGMPTEDMPLSIERLMYLLFILTKDLAEDMKLDYVSTLALNLLAATQAIEEARLSDIMLEWAAMHKAIKDARKEAKEDDEEDDEEDDGDSIYFKAAGKADKSTKEGREVYRLLQKLLESTEED